MVTKFRKTLRKLSTAEKREQIFDLIKYGFSYSEVGEMMDMSKSAVSGFVFRDKQPKKRKLNPHAHTVKKVKNKINLDMPVINEGITIFELKETTCRYMIGDHKYCGLLTHKRSYCLEHYKACCEPNTRKRKSA